MKKRLLIGTIFSSLVLAACTQTPAPTTPTTTVPPITTETIPTTPEATTPEVTTPEVTTPTPTTPTPTTPEPVVLEMTLSVSKDAEADGSYKLKIGEEMTVTPVFNVQGHEEEVTYSATENSGFFGPMASTNVTITNGVIKAVGKASKITLTVTSTVNNFVQEIIISTYAELDNYDTDIRAKLDAALIKEAELCSEIYLENNKTTSTEIYEVTIFENGYEYAQSVVTDEHVDEYYGYNGVYDAKYHSYKTNLNDNTATISVKDTIPSNLTLFAVKVSSMNSYNGISAAVKYYYTNYFTSSAYNYASIEATENTYSITSEYNTDTWGVKTHTELELNIAFDDDKLVLFEFEKNEYDNSGYDFENNEVTGSSTSDNYVSAELVYETRAEKSSTYDPQSFYFTSYDVVLKDEEGKTGTTFQAGNILTFDYGTNVAPDTAIKEFDKLNFVSSSDVNVININDEGKLACLAAGTATLKFITDGGVEKEITVTVEGEIVKLSDAEIKQILESKEWLNQSQNVFTGALETKGKLTFVEGHGEFTLTSNGAVMSFDYDVVDGTLVISNLTSSSSNYSIAEITFNENISEITVKYNEKSAFGSYSYSYKMK